MKTTNNNDAHCTLHTMHGILNELDYPRTRFCNINGKRILNAKKARQENGLRIQPRKKCKDASGTESSTYHQHTHRVYIRGQIFSVR